MIRRERQKNNYENRQTENSRLLKDAADYIRERYIGSYCDEEQSDVDETESTQSRFVESDENITVYVFYGVNRYLENVEIGSGSVVMANAVINPSTKIGRGCIINICASVDHDNQIADYVHVSVGAHLAGCVSVGERTWIGIGAVVSNNIEICGDCMIGAGGVVVKNITESGTYIGIPTRNL